MKKPNLTIVVTFYKNVEYVYIVLDSIMQFVGNSQHFIEVILVNDSADDSFIKLNKSYPFPFKVIQLEYNIGVTGARNIGYNSSNSNFVLFYDSDDLLLPDAFESVIEFVFNNKANVYFFRCIDENYNLIGLSQNKPLIHNTPNLFYGKGECIICVEKNKYNPFIGFLRGCENAGLLFFAIKSKGLVFCWADFPIRLYKKNLSGLSSKINTPQRSTLITIGHFISFIFSFFLFDFCWALRFYISFLYRFILTFFSTILYVFKR